MLVALSSLPLDSSGRIHSLDPSFSQRERRRLFDLGLVEGTSIRPQMRSPGGDPTAYRIRGTLIALRKEQASKIQVICDG